MHRFVDATQRGTSFPFATLFDLIVIVPELENMHQFSFFKSILDHQFYMIKHTWIPSHMFQKKIDDDVDVDVHTLLTISNLFSYTIQHKNESSVFRVLTYNLWNFNTPYFERLELITKNIRDLNADLVGLQEVKYTNFEYPSKRTECKNSMFKFSTLTKCKKSLHLYGHQLWDIVTKFPEYQFIWAPAHHEFRDVSPSSSPSSSSSSHASPILYSGSKYFFVLFFILFSYY
jgi:hypothetical protein